MPSLSFKPELLDKVIRGRKTETRRLSREGESIANGVLWSRQHSPKPHSFLGIRRLFRVGQSYAVVPGRGQHQVGRVVVTQLRLERLFDITQESVDRECFGATPQEYISRFQAMYKRSAKWNPLLRVVTFRLAITDTAENILSFFDYEKGEWACGILGKDNRLVRFGATQHQARRAFRKDFPEFRRQKITKRTCRICGCTDDHACNPPCWWVDDDACSSCVR